MGRSVIAVVVGTLVGSVVVLLIELPGYFLHPLPAGFVGDQAELNRHFAQAPLAAKALVAVGWTVGPFVAALIACWIARRKFVLHGLCVGAIFMALNLINILSFPHPVWLAAVGILAPPASGYVAAKIVAAVSRRGPRPTDMRERNMAC